jgi:AAA domain-containing protein
MGKKTLSRAEIDALIKGKPEPAIADNQAPGKTWCDGLITAADLQTKQFRPVRIILPGLIPEGVTILAGKPKVGKSWLALDVCLAVADESRFVLGDTRPVHGNALYLALEDNQRRLKKRIDKIVQSGRAPERLQLHTEWKRMDHGGLEDIEAWCKSVKEPRLIWIDTLAKIRPLAGRNEQAYAADYRAIEGLQKLSGQYQVGIVLNHHLRKMSSEDDAFDDVSGTLGLTGAADTIIVMKRHSGLTKIFVRGRDLEEAEFAAEFNRNTCRWRIVGDAEDVFRSQERQTIIAALKQAAPDPMSIGDIMAATERRDRNATKSLLHKMKTAGEVISERGCYSLPPTDLLNSVDRVDWEPVSASAVNQGPHNATVSGMANGQRNGQRAVNGQRSVDQALTGTKTDKPLNAASNSDSGQQVNAVNAKEGAIEGEFEELPAWKEWNAASTVYRKNKPALGPEGDSLDDLH